MIEQAQTETIVDTRALTIAVVAGETSGDMLGGGLLAQLKKRYPNATFEGIGGERMQQQGLTSLVPMERLAVMGLVEVLGRLRELLGIRRRLIKRWQTTPPDVFIGIDAPDFNLTLAQKLKEKGIKTVHYVSPSVWMWRQKRVFKIAKAVDLMLTLFPFEAKFYEQHHVPVRCVGHHLADKIPYEPDTPAARDALNVNADARCICVMPGSRQGEVNRLGELFLDACEQLQEQLGTPIHWLLPCANDERYQQMSDMLARRPNLQVQLLHGQSQMAITASDAVLLASGTAALEAMLLKKPMVVSYRVARISQFFLSFMLKHLRFSLPNLLSEQDLVPELIQDDATPSNLAQALMHALDKHTPQYALQQSEFLRLHKLLATSADDKAARSVAELLEQGRVG